MFTYLSNIGVESATVISHVAQWALTIFVVSIALEQLSIGGEIMFDNAARLFDLSATDSTLEKGTLWGRFR